MGDYTNAGRLKKLYKKIDTAGLTNEDIEFFVLLAEGEVKGYVAKRYDITFPDGVPDLIINVASEKALLKLLDRFFTSETPTAGTGKTTSGGKLGWRDRRTEDCQRILEGIANGDILLTLPDGSIITERTDTGNVISTTSEYTPTFGEGSPIDEEVDPDKIQDEIDDRL